MVDAVVAERVEQDGQGETQLHPGECGTEAVVSTEAEREWLRVGSVEAKLAGVGPTPGVTVGRPDHQPDVVASLEQGAGNGEVGRRLSRRYLNR